MHIIFLGYISTIYPILLILLTWLMIELRDKLVVYLWKPFHRCFVRLRRSWNTKSDLIDVFASFLLLSYATLMYQSLVMMDITEIDNFSLKEVYRSSQYVPRIDRSITPTSAYYIISASISGVIFLSFNLLSMVLLSLYPVKRFRALLSKCKLDRASLMIFIEKFQSCYRDGLDGGKDMRSLSALYFLLRIVIFFGATYINHFLGLRVWFVRGTFLATAAILIALSRPYKKMYMTVSDTLLLFHMALLCFIVSTGPKKQGIDTVHLVIFLQSFLLLPFTVFLLIIMLKVIHNVYVFVKTVRCGNRHTDHQRLLQPVNPNYNAIH